jgi:hypothetical protein
LRIEHSLSAIQNRKGAWTVVSVIVGVGTTCEKEHVKRPQIWLGRVCRLVIARRPVFGIKVAALS